MGRLTSDEPYQPDGEGSEEILEATQPVDGRQVDRARQAAPRAYAPGMAPPAGFNPYVGGRKVVGLEAVEHMHRYGDAVERGRTRLMDLQQRLTNAIAAMTAGETLPKAEAEQIVTLALLELLSQPRIPTRLAAARMLGETVGMFKKVQVQETPQGLLTHMRELERALGSRTVRVEARSRVVSEEVATNGSALVRGSDPADNATARESTREPRPRTRDT